jgi:hypothetical protein
MKFTVEGNVTIEYLPNGMNDRDCVQITIPGIGPLMRNMRMRFTLSDAESIGEAMIGCVRVAEQEREGK